MIQKTLTITVVEKDEVTGEPHFNVRLYRGPSEGKLIIEPLIQGKFVVDEADLLEASRELKEFYAEPKGLLKAGEILIPGKPTKEKATKISRRITQDRAKSTEPAIASIPNTIPSDTKLKKAEPEITMTWGDDEEV